MLRARPAKAGGKPATPKPTKQKVPYKGTPHTVYKRGNDRYVKVFSKTAKMYRYVKV